MFKYLSHQEFKHPDLELWSWVREYQHMNPDQARFVVEVGEKNVDGVISMKEFGAYIGGEEAFRQALTIAGHDPNRARAEYEKALELAREMPQLPNGFMPRKANSNKNENST